ncbi:MAG TPA: peptidylprolyl isomerase [Geobacteraceae bacterium]|nr:peptidylprolyl isomerase [Geobacteraceae bacterium]
MQTFGKSVLRPIIATLVVTIGLSGAAFAAAKKKEPGKDAEDLPRLKTTGVIATVNGVPLYRPELDRALKFMLAQRQVKKDLTSNEINTAEHAVLDQLISAELLYQAGKKSKIDDIEKRIDSQINIGKSKFSDKALYDKALKESGLTEKNLREFARKEIYINNLIEKEISSKISVSDTDAKKFYDENVDRFKQPETVQASHILIGVSADATAKEKNKAREKAESLLKRVKAGEDFATLAKTNSTCPSASQGGNLGYFSKGQMVPEFETVAFSLKPGETSEIVETKFGYHIVKVIDKKPAGTIPFPEAKQEIINYLKIAEIQQGINQLVGKLRKEGTIVIK